MSRSLMESTVYHPKQLLWFIVLYFCVDVHSCFAVFMSCNVALQYILDSEEKKDET